MAQTSVFILAPDFPELEDCDMITGPYAQSLATAKRMGYDGVEIAIGDAEKFDPTCFKALLQEHGLKISAINSGGIQYLFRASLVNADRKKMEFALEQLKTNIRHCRELGCLQQVGVSRGYAVPGRSMRWFKDCLADILREATLYAAQLEVPVVFEYTNRFEINTINTGAEAREIVERVGSPNLGILIDTYHSWLEDPDVCQNIRDLKCYVRHFHLHDSNRGAATIADGENDFDRILDTCGQIGYHGWFSDGLLTMKYREEDLRRSTSTLRQLYEKHRV